MPLEEYSRKRDFRKTPEPAPDQVSPRVGRLSYLIQKHDATRLHYDFRLELDGVLLSWAVTKGPSLNPADKRLAVRTEDHPLSYKTFEGTIPQGEYGGGTVMMWDEGTWEPKGDARAGLEKGHLSFILHGQRLKGGWGLIRMRGDAKRENWLLVKENDLEARKNGANEQFLDNLASSVKTGRSMDDIARSNAPATPRKQDVAKSPSRLDELIGSYPEVQLATLVDDPPQGDDWLHEIKFDGYRLLGFVSDGTSALRTRNGKDWTEKFPSLTTAMNKLKAQDAVIDMEAVILDAQGKSSFQSLQEALGDGGKPEKIVAYVFDLLYLDGKDLTHLPLTQRKELLEGFVTKSKQDRWLKYSAHIAGEGQALFSEACKKGLEGIISKRANAPYSAGRQKSWLKIKCSLRQEFIILGFSDAHTGDRALGALYIGYRKDGALRYAGKVGTGFSMKSARELADQFKGLAIEKPTLARSETQGLSAGEWKTIHWIDPSLLCEVAFTEWTQDGLIRHPSFQGLREDKGALEVHQETPETTPSAATAKKRGKSAGLVLAGVTITHPDRVVSDVSRVTKGEVAEYYAEIAPLLLPQIIRRPLSILRCPSGIDGECFFQRNPGRGLGADIKPFEFMHNGKRSDYFYIADIKGLLEVVQMGALELHPWGATIDAIDCPDRMIFDLDPAPDVPFAAVKLACEDLRLRLQNKGMESTLKCTGGKGMHVTVPLSGNDKWPVVKAFAASLAAEMAAATPQAYVDTMSKAKRAGKIFIDYFRNDYTATSIADYAVRARPGIPVALPLDWKELKNLESASQFTLKDALKRLTNKKLRPAAPPRNRTTLTA